MPGRIFLANVGANASHRFCSPVFEDGAFEFLPIPETPDLSDPHAVRYKDLKAFSDGRDLKRHIPARLWEVSTHNDPEFETFTYGDNCEVSPRAASLKRAQPGDFLFFIARLERWLDGKPTREYGFYLIGFLEIAEIFPRIDSRPPDAVITRIGNNAHVRRGLYDAALWDSFWVFRGSERSRRFLRAVPVTRELASRVFTCADGSPWQWDSGRTDLQVIGSYTRSCRCVIDPHKPGHSERARALWEWIAQFEGGTVG
ncbi:MAG: hypothetical protein L0177_05475 [Chloroflexi bacterium]|nr:hypothetical protein [Chloroflexota bacterium]